MLATIDSDVSSENKPGSLRDFFPYEILKYSGHLKILDPRRRVAIFERRQRVRFLEDNVGVCMDHVWGEGVLFAGYQAENLRIIDLIATRKGYVIVLALPRLFKKGEVLEIVTSRKMIGSFYLDEAYWEVAMSAPTELLTLNVESAPGTGMRAPTIVAPPKGDFDATARGRRLSFRVGRPGVHIPYRVTWHWK